MIPRKQMHLKYIVIASCMLLFAVSMSVVAKIPFIAERMQAMPKEEVQSLADMTNSQEINADLFSRPFSDAERNRIDSIRE